MAAWPAKPAASDAVAYATLEGFGARVDGGESAAGTARVSTGALPQNRNAIARAFSLRSARRIRADYLAGTRADPMRNALHFPTYFQRSFSPEIGHYNDQDRAVLDLVKALDALDPAGSGLDDASAQLEVALT
jgi:hypothetical protein